MGAVALALLFSSFEQERIQADGRRQMGAAWMALGVIDVHDDLQVTG